MEHPYAPGTTVDASSWSITIAPVDLDADDEVAAGWVIVNGYEYVEPDAGNVWIQVPVDASYSGTEPSSTLDVHVAFVTSDSDSYDQYTVVANTDDMNPMAEAAAGDSYSYVESIQVAIDDIDGGLVRVSCGDSGDAPFYVSPE